MKELAVISDSRTDRQTDAKFLDGEWERVADEGGYRRYQIGPVEVRFHDEFEPDGELVTNGPVRVHLERMSDESWWMGLSWGEAGEMVSVGLDSKKKIRVLWGDDR